MKTKTSVVRSSTRKIPIENDRAQAVLLCLVLVFKGHKGYFNDFVCVKLHIIAYNELILSVRKYKTMFI